MSSLQLPSVTPDPRDSHANVSVIAHLEKLLAQKLEQARRTSSSTEKAWLAAIIEELREVISKTKAQTPAPPPPLPAPGQSARDVNQVNGTTVASVVGDGHADVENAAGGNISHRNVQVEHADKVEVVYPPGASAAQPEVSAASLAECERDYLLFLKDTASRVPLGKLDLQMALPSYETPDIRLGDIYVPLDTMRTRPHSERGGTPPALEPDPVLGVINRSKQQLLVLLGDPGSGKTSFLNFLTLCLTGARLYPDKGYLEMLSVPQTENRRAANWRYGPLLPVRVDLRDFANDIPAKTTRGTASLLWTHIASRLKDHNLGEFADQVKKALRQGQALAMFDGLDEVAGQKQRHIVRDAVIDFAKSYPRSRFLVTCRVLSYTNPDWQLGSFSAVTLAPLSENSIYQFIDKWYHALARRGHLDHAVARAKARELRDAAIHLHDLAQNPMLLTVMAVVHTYKGTLPRERARLYDDCVYLLLLEWQRAKQIGPVEWQKGIVEELGTREERLINGLCEVAFQAHSAQHGQTSTVNISQGDVLRVLQRYLEGDWGKAQKFCNYVEKRAGLLIGKGQDKKGEAVFAFPHRGFQEFLAACHIVSDREDFGRRVAELAAKGDIWREVLVLAVGHLVYNRLDVYRPLNAINLLCKPCPPEDDNGWRALWWAAEMLNIVGRPVAEQDEHIGKQLVPRLISQLVRLVEGGHLTPVERAQAADALGCLGDPRPGVCTLEPEMVRIEGGAFQMGPKDQQHPVVVRPFCMARYPVTNAQFRAFMTDEDGYNNPENWLPAGRAWLERAGQRGGFIDDPKRGTPNRPVVGITWYEALAFVNWLRRKTGKRFRLPTEAEWERAAAGLEGRRYPSGNRASDDSINTREAGIGETTAVGIFPQDMTPEGIYDMGGNVWEWCSSLARPYPYQADDGREKLNAPGPRALRGGACVNEREKIHCTQQRSAEPHARVPLIGLRLVRDDK